MTEDFSTVVLLLWEACVHSPTVVRSRPQWCADYTGESVNSSHVIKKPTV